MMGYKVNDSYKLVCDTCEAERNEPFCQTCEPTSGQEAYTPRHDGFEAYEAELDREGTERANRRKKAEQEGDLVDIFDNA